VLDKVLGKLARQHDPNVLVGFDYADDAGVYQIAPDMALVQTVDFFTPVVDDPYAFGQIAATNSLSDIYAMGGRPLTALALVCFPEKGDLEILQQILAGGLSKMMEAGCTVIGGHSVRDDDTKFGYSVTGTVHPSTVLKNGGARPGDRLLLTKMLGTGVIATAIKNGLAEQAWIEGAIESMTSLNKAAAEVITEFNAQPGERRSGPDELSRDRRLRGSRENLATAPIVGLKRGSPVHGLTDITGFGLIGHAREMALASNVSLRLDAGQVPLLAGALDCVRAGQIPGGLKANREFAECVAEYEDGITEELKTMLFDPQTAGGLLISVGRESADDLRMALNERRVRTVEIGEVLARSKPLIRVAP
jgi:selenide, water dikinase